MAERSETLAEILEAKVRERHHNRPPTTEAQREAELQMARAGIHGPQTCECQPGRFARDEYGDERCIYCAKGRP